MKTPAQVYESLAEEDRKLLNLVLAVEKKHLHEANIKANSGLEKDIVKEIIQTINRALPDEN